MSHESRFQTQLPSDRLRSPDGQANPLLIGREREIDFFSARLSDTTGSGLAVWRITAEPGGGKTALLDGFAEICERKGIPYLLHTFTPEDATDLAADPIILLRALIETHLDSVNPEKRKDIIHRNPNLKQLQKYHDDFLEARKDAPEPFLDAINEIVQQYPEQDAPDSKLRELAGYSEFKQVRNCFYDATTSCQIPIGEQKGESLSFKPFVLMLDDFDILPTSVKSFFVESVLKYYSLVRQPTTAVITSNLGFGGDWDELWDGNTISCQEHSSDDSEFPPPDRLKPLNSQEAVKLLPADYQPAEHSFLQPLIPEVCDGNPLLITETIRFIRHPDNRYRSPEGIRQALIRHLHEFYLAEMKQAYPSTTEQSWRTTQLLSFIPRWDKESALEVIEGIQAEFGEGLTASDLIQSLSPFAKWNDWHKAYSIAGPLAHLKRLAADPEQVQLVNKSMAAYIDRRLDPSLPTSLIVKDLPVMLYFQSLRYPAVRQLAVTDLFNHTIEIVGNQIEAYYLRQLRHFKNDDISTKSIVSEVKTSIEGLDLVLKNLPLRETMDIWDNEFEELVKEGKAKLMQQFQTGLSRITGLQTDVPGGNNK